MPGRPSWTTSTPSTAGTGWIDPPRPSRKWYSSARWQRRRKAQLDDEPLCRMCLEQGHVTPATVCDHITPHKDQEEAFWSGPFQSLCAAHHDSTKAREENRGHRIGCDVHGWPLE